MLISDSQTGRGNRTNNFQNHVITIILPPESISWLRPWLMLIMKRGRFTKRHCWKPPPPFQMISWKIDALNFAWFVEAHWPNQNPWSTGKNKI